MPVEAETYEAYLQCGMKSAVQGGGGMSPYLLLVNYITERKLPMDMDKAELLVRYIEQNANVKEAFEEVYGPHKLPNLKRRIALDKTAKEVQSMTDAEYAKVRKEVLASAAVNR